MLTAFRIRKRSRFFKNREKKLYRPTNYFETTRYGTSFYWLLLASNRCTLLDPNPVSDYSLDPDPKTFLHEFILCVQLVREASWSAIEGTASMETITVAKTSLLADVQAAVEKELGLGKNCYLCCQGCGSGSGPAFVFPPDLGGKIFQI